MFMAKKSYGVMNMSYRDESRKEDYLLYKTATESKLNIPINMPSCGVMYPTELTNMICTDTLREYETDTYSKKK